MGLPLIAWRRRWICESCHHSFPRTSGWVRASADTERAEALVHEKHSYPGFLVVAAILIGVVALCYIQYRIQNPN